MKPKRLIQTKKPLGLAPTGSQSLHHAFLQSRFSQSAIRAANLRLSKQTQLNNRSTGTYFHSQRKIVFSGLRRGADKFNHPPAVIRSGHVNSNRGLVVTGPKVGLHHQQHRQQSLQVPQPGDVPPTILATYALPTQDVFMAAVLEVAKRYLKHIPGDELLKMKRMFIQWKSEPDKLDVNNMYKLAGWRAIYTQNLFNSRIQTVEYAMCQLLDIPMARAVLSEARLFTSLGCGPGPDIASAILVLRRNLSARQPISFLGIDQFIGWSPYITSMHLVDPLTNVSFEKLRVDETSTSQLHAADVCVMSYTDAAIHTPGFWHKIKILYNLILILDQNKRELCIELTKQGFQGVEYQLKGLKRFFFYVKPVNMRRPIAIPPPIPRVASGAQLQQQASLLAEEDNGENEGRDEKEEDVQSSEPAKSSSATATAAMYGFGGLSQFDELAQVMETFRQMEAAHVTKTKCGTGGKYSGALETRRRRMTKEGMNQLLRARMLELGEDPPEEKPVAPPPTEQEPTTQAPAESSESSNPSSDEEEVKVKVISESVMSAPPAISNQISVVGAHVSCPSGGAAGVVGIGRTGQLGGGGFRSRGRPILVGEEERVSRGPPYRRTPAPGLLPNPRPPQLDFVPILPDVGFAPPPQPPLPPPPPQPMSNFPTYPPMGPGETAAVFDLRQVLDINRIAYPPPQQMPAPPPAYSAPQYLPYPMPQVANMPAPAAPLPYLPAGWAPQPQLVQQQTIYPTPYDLMYQQQVYQPTQFNHPATYQRPTYLSRSRSFSRSRSRSRSWTRSLSRSRSRFISRSRSLSRSISRSRSRSRSRTISPMRSSRRRQWSPSINRNAGRKVETRRKERRSNSRQLAKNNFPPAATKRRRSSRSSRSITSRSSSSSVAGHRRMGNRKESRPKSPPRPKNSLLRKPERKDFGGKEKTYESIRKPDDKKRSDDKSVREKETKRRISPDRKQSSKNSTANDKDRNRRERSPVFKQPSSQKPKPTKSSEKSSPNMKKAPLLIDKPIEKKQEIKRHIDKSPFFKQSSEKKRETKTYPVKRAELTSPQKEPTVARSSDDRRRNQKVKRRGSVMTNSSCDQSDDDQPESRLKYSVSSKSTDSVKSRRPNLDSDRRDSLEKQSSARNVYMPPRVQIVPIKFETGRKGNVQSSDDEEQEDGGSGSRSGGTKFGVDLRDVLRAKRRKMT